MNRLEVKNLSVEIRGEPILDWLNLTVKAGEVAEEGVCQVTTRVLQVKLPDELDAEVGAAIAAGEYASAEDAVVGAVAEWRAGRRLDASLDREALRSLWREGVESGRSGSRSIDDLKIEARRRFKQA